MAISISRTVLRCIILKDGFLNTSYSLVFMGLNKVANVVLSRPKNI